MASGRRQLFIYWRVTATDVPAALHAARQAQRWLCTQHPALRAALFRREDTGGGEATLMETYAVSEPAAGIDDELRRHIDTALAAATRAWLKGTRHIEVFDAV